MAYVAMNCEYGFSWLFFLFLNGVCRHEQEAAQRADQPQGEVYEHSPA